jgi:cytochrome b6-f complex iron-sulfur subunit
MTDHSDQAPPTGRRNFLNLAIAGTATALGAMAAYPVVVLLLPHERTSGSAVLRRDLFDITEGSSRTVLVGQRPVLVLRLADGSFRAFSAVCTHLNCIVKYSPERQRIECPCHGGVFDLHGKNVAGPPPRPLREVRVATDGEELLLSEG